MVYMSPYEMFPELWEECIQSLSKMYSAKDDEVMDGMFQCKRCKSWKTTYYQLQTRCADEPMTTFHECTACQKRWKS